MILNWVPYSVQTKSFLKSSAYRPQVNFLPLAPKRGILEVLPQKPLKRYERELQQRKEEEQNAIGDATRTQTVPAATII